MEKSSCDIFFSTSTLDFSLISVRKKLSKLDLHTSKAKEKIFSEKQDCTLKTVAKFKIPNFLFIGLCLNVCVHGGGPGGGGWFSLFYHHHHHHIKDC